MGFLKGDGDGGGGNKTPTNPVEIPTIAAPQFAGPRQFNPALSVNQTLNPATDPMLASIGGVVPTAPSLRFTPTQDQADAAFKYQSADIDAYNKEANAFNEKNRDKINRGKVEPMAIKQQMTRPVIDPTISYDISQYNPYDPYGNITDQLMKYTTSMDGGDKKKKKQQSEYAPPTYPGGYDYNIWEYGAFRNSPQFNDGE